MMRSSVNKSFVAVCSGCGVLLGCFATVAFSAEPIVDDKRAFLLDAFRTVPTSKPGEPLGSVSVDPLTSPTQEAAIQAYLARYDSSSWYGQTIERLAATLNESVPTYLNRLELDALGVDPAQPLAMDIDSLPNTSIGARLAIALEALDLTYIIRRGCLEITSRDGADSDPVSRVYDVSPLVRSWNRSSVASSQHGQTKYHDLIYTIEQHIDPDNWLAAGGRSSISPYESGTRGFLVVSAPTSTHLKVHALLSTLNASLPVGGQYELAPLKPIATATSVLKFRLPASADSRLPRPYLKLSGSR